MPLRIGALSDEAFEEGGGRDVAEAAHGARPGLRDGAAGRRAVRPRRGAVRRDVHRDAEVPAGGQ